MDPNAMQRNTEKACVLLKAMANTHRLMIMCLLHDNEMSVNQLNDELSIPQSTLSQNLAVLRKASLVSTRRDAQNIYYSLASDEVIAIISTLHSIYCNEE